MEVRSVGKRQRLDVLALNGTVVRMGQEFSIAASQKTYDDHYSRSKQYATDHTCHVWCIDFRTCAGKPEDFQEPLVSPTTARVTRAGSKVHFYSYSKFGARPLCERLALVDLSLLASALLTHDMLAAFSFFLHCIKSSGLKSFFNC